MALVTFTAYLVGLTIAFGLRTAIHKRRTGTSGFKGISGTPRNASWWGGLLFAAAILLGIAGPGLAAANVVHTNSPTGLSIAGLIVAGVGLLATVFAQSAMGDQWRIGVDEAERTELVTSGMFAAVRNPIFSSMVFAQAGVSLAALNAISLVSFVLLIVAIRIQVRYVEEPFLLRLHGERYAQYLNESARFVPRFRQP